ncbi:MAG: ATP-grasp domain-containing protein [Gemella sp.]|nr:ATP-grasp domain-containing protein [Gemella sp.]
MNFILTSPHFPENMEFFAMRLKEEGVNVLGIGDRAYDELSDTLKFSLTEYFKVDNLENLDEMKRAVAFLIYKYGPIDRIESNNEHWLFNDAILREQFNVPGIRPEELSKTMYKSKMKELFRNSKVPVVEGYIVNEKADLDKAIKKLGYPFIAKPNHGVGTSATYKIESAKDVDTFLEEWNGTEYFLEPFVEDAELCTYDGLIDSEGNIVYETTFYYNKPTLEQANGGESGYVVEATIDPKLQKYGHSIVKSFGMKERFFHIEFFRKKDGEYVALEYNNRSAGGYSIDLYNFAISNDLYKIYAQIVAGTLEKQPTYNLRYASSTSRRNEVEYVHTREEIIKKYGEDIKMIKKVPEIFSGLMGNEVFVVLSDSRKEADEIMRYIHKQK